MNRAAFTRGSTMRHVLVMMSTSAAGLLAMFSPVVNIYADQFSQQLLLMGLSPLPQALGN